MIAKLLMASCLVAATVIIHAAGLGIALSRVSHSNAQPDTRFWPITWLLIRVAWLLIVIHLLEIAVWALFFWWQNCLPDAGPRSIFPVLPTPRSVTGTSYCRKSGNCSARLKD